MEEAGRDEALTTNLRAVFVCMKSQIPALLARGGGMLEAGPGARARPGILHRKLGGSAYRVVSGFKIKLTEFTLPIDKPPQRS